MALKGKKHKSKTSNTSSKQEEDQNVGINNAPTTSDCWSLATYTTTAPCQYHRGHALTINGLSLEHDGGRVLFTSADISLPHATITGLVGTNGAGKSSFAQVLASRVLEGFPDATTFRVEYLAAADDEDGHSSPSLQQNVQVNLQSLPKEYIQSRIQLRLDGLKQTIESLESLLESEDTPEDTVEEIAEELSTLYQKEESIVESMERETDHAMDQVGLKAYANRPLALLSCGWRYKCRLIAALLTRPDFLIIDEPSFLDSTSTNWLRNELQEMANSHKAIVLLISHKEALLQAVCDRILHLNAAQESLTTYNCDYQTFKQVQETELQHNTKQLEESHDKYEQADKSLKKVQAVVKKREGNFHKITQENADKRFIKGKNKESKQNADRSAASKLKQAQQAVVEAESLRNKTKRERVKPLVIEGLAAEGTILKLENVGFAYDTADDFVFQNVDTSLDATDRVLLQGANGCGKSTLIKLILGQLQPSEGAVQTTLENILYFPQTALYTLLKEHGQQTAMEFLSEVRKMTETQTRQHLASLGLAKDLALHPVRTLSAGQRVRLWLARALLQHPKPALLILDEASENVDVATRQSLVEMLDNFPAACLVISHDADFCESFRYTKTWRLWRHGMKVEYPE